MGSRSLHSARCLCVFCRHGYKHKIYVCEIDILATTFIMSLIRVLYMINQKRFYTELGRKIFGARARLRLTQEELSLEVGLSRTSITNIERGRQKLLLHSILDLANALKVEPSDLIPVISVKRDAKNRIASLLEGASTDQKAWAKSDA